MAKFSAVCEYVQDGDTFRTTKQNWIRLAAVCAPDEGEPEYDEAKSILKKLILNKSITYEQVSTSYGRIVAEVWVGGISVNVFMREQGYTCP